MPLPDVAAAQLENLFTIMIDFLVKLVYNTFQQR